jgi:hypothetical protein
MKPAPEYLGRAGVLLTRKLAQYERYSALLGEQEEALEEGDFEAFHTLSQEADRIRREVDDGADASDEMSTEEQTHAAEIIREAVTQNVRIRERLSRMRGETVQQIRQMTRRRPQARSYLAEPAGTGELGPRLDVRS